MYCMNKNGFFLISVDSIITTPLTLGTLSQRVPLSQYSITHIQSNTKWTTYSEIGDAILNNNVVEYLLFRYERLCAVAFVICRDQQ